MSTISQENIEALRKRFLDEASANPDKYHPTDIERVKTEEWQVRRYLIENNDNIEQAFQHMCRSLKWKKEFGVHDFTDDSFPIEFYQVNGVEFCGRSKSGAYLQWEVLRNQYSFKELTLYYKQFIAYQLEKLDRMAGENGFVTITDASGSGVSNVDMEVTRFKIDTIDNYPAALKGIFMVELPWLMGSVMKIVVSMMSPKLKTLVKYYKSNELTNEIDPEYIPTSLKGQRDKPAFVCGPKSICDMYETMQLDDKFVDKYFKTLKIARPH